MKRRSSQSSWLNIGLNVIVPTLILVWGGSQLGLEPWQVLVLGLAGPIGYGSFELLTAKKVNPLSVLGLVSVGLTGGIGLLELDPQWVAIKEAAVPGVLAVVVFGSAFTKHPVLKTFLYEAAVLDVGAIEESVADAGEKTASELQSLYKNATILVALSFVMSAVLNYGLAAYIVKSPAGTEAFNEELGQMTAYSFVVIMAPSMAVTLGVMAWFLKRLQTITGLSLDALTNDSGGDDEWEE